MKIDNNIYINGNNIKYVEKIIANIDADFIIKFLSFIIFVLPPMIVYFINMTLFALDDYLQSIVVAILGWGMFSWFVFIRNIDIYIDKKIGVFGLLFATFGTYGFIIALMIYHWFIYY